VTALVLVTSASRQPSAVATYYAEESVSGGHGRNIVNVILVDFRALDTLGEITVLAVAAFGVYALLKYRPSRHRRGPRFFGGIAAPAGKEGEGE
jgi:multicomponent Na+:H+ antiporter subunit A